MDRTLKVHLRNIVLSKHARLNIDIEALIEKRHQDAKLKIFSNPSPGDLQPNKESMKRTTTMTSNRRNRQVSLSPDLSETGVYSGSDSDGSVFQRSARRRSKAKSKKEPFKVALRLYRQASSEEVPRTGFCCSFGTIFFDHGSTTSNELFTYICQHTKTNCSYLEFHPPEDMSLEGRIRVDRGSESADDTFQSIMTMLREAPKFGGEPSYRTVEVEVGVAGIDS